MRFRITGAGWPINGGSYLAPAGRVFDFSNPQDRELAQGLIPLNATPLDPEALHAQQRAYPAHLLGGSSSPQPSANCPLRIFGEIWGNGSCS